MVNTTFLNSLGLSDIEGRIYLCLLQTHRETISGIAKGTGIHRPMLYKSIPELVEKGLVSPVKVGRRTFYIAENPNRLELLLNNLKSGLSEQLPELARVYEGSQKRPTVRYYEGKKAIQNIYEEMVRRSKKGDSIYRYESPREFQAIGKYYPKLYIERATGPKGELEKHVITNEATSGKRRERLWRHTKAIPYSFDPFDYNITQLIYKDTVAFIDFDTETATVIKNKRFAEFQLKIFKMLFRKL